MEYVLENKLILNIPTSTNKYKSGFIRTYGSSVTDSIPKLEVNCFEGKYLKTLTSAEVENLFHKYAFLWKLETGFKSIISNKIKNENYIKIQSLGIPAIPLILEDLKSKPTFWFDALEKITGENPVLDKHKGNIKKMTKDWLKWGKKKGYIE